MERAASDAGLGEILILHDEIDRETARLAACHGSRLQCRQGCSTCCVDDLTVYEIEAQRIRAAHPALLERATPHAPGACAFLDGAGGCRIYADRPYVCRTQGLPLRWWAENEREELVESRDVCPLNAEGPALESLPDDDCWLIGPFEDRLRRLQEARDGARGRRVALRSLFRSSS